MKRALLKECLPYLKSSVNECYGNFWNAMASTIMID